MNYTNLFSILVMILCLSCHKENFIVLSDGTETVEIAYPNVDPALWSYFQLFEIEGAQRGLSIDLAQDQISGNIEEIDETDVIGQCHYSSYFPNSVTIDKTFWLNASDAYKEMVVFHELGHCYLLRGHDETAKRGVCQSIMNSGNGHCRTFYNAENRSLYLDELFGMSNR